MDGGIYFIPDTLLDKKISCILERETSPLYTLTTPQSPCPFLDKTAAVRGSAVVEEKHDHPIARKERTWLQESLTSFRKLCGFLEDGKRWRKR